MSKLELSSDQLRQALNWPTDHWVPDTDNSTLSQSDDEVINKLGSSLKCGIFGSRDNIIYDQTSEGISKLEKFFCNSSEVDCPVDYIPKFIYKKTFYLCLFSSATMSSKQCIPPEMSPILWPFAAILLDKSCNEYLNESTRNIIQKIQTISSNVDPLKDNDGMVTVINQCVPRGAESLVEVFPEHSYLTSHITNLHPGVWYIDSVNKWIGAINRNTFDLGTGCQSMSVNTSVSEKGNYQTPLDFQRSLYRNIFLYISSVQMFFENTNEFIHNVYNMSEF
ncbi:unnamed protein product [Heterobilharzia americana]|nr:unnamed protein product [Heterobilharzia americana]